MSNVLMLVEGQTEEIFVRDILGPYLWNFNVFCTPKVATTKRVAARPDFKGGIVSYGKLKFDIKCLLEDSSARLVTTMIDYYGFSSRVPFKNKISGANCFQRVKKVWGQVNNPLISSAIFFKKVETQNFARNSHFNEVE